MQPLYRTISRILFLSARHYKGANGEKQTMPLKADSLR